MATSSTSPCVHTCTTTNSLDFKPTLKVVSCTLSSASSISSTSLLNRFTYDLSDSPSSCLIVSRWSTGLFCRCPLTKWCTNELLSCSKSSIDDWANFLNRTCTAPLRVAGKEWHRISYGVCYRLRVILKVVMWSNGSFRLSYNPSWGKWNLGGKRHSRTFVVKRELVLFTISSKFLFVFSFMAFFSSSISFLMLLRRSLLTPSDGSILLELSFLLLFSSSLFLLTLFLAREWFLSYCNCCLISWFCLVSSSILAVNVWTYKANAIGSYGVFDSI